MGARLKRVALTGRIAYHVAKERITNPRPITLREVPPTPEHLTDEWLTLALGDGVAGARVVSHELGPRHDGTWSRRTLQVEFNETGRATGLTEQPFTESGPGFMTRLASAAVGLGVIEATFYAQIRRRWASRHLRRSSRPMTAYFKSHPEQKAPPSPERTATLADGSASNSMNAATRASALSGSIAIASFLEPAVNDSPHRMMLFDTNHSNASV